MTYIDFHTHRLPETKDVVAVVDGRDTWGIHPWNAVPASLAEVEEKRSVLISRVEQDGAPGLLAIGECGLDALRGPSPDVQEALFRRHVALSEEVGRPLVIHCVRALDLLLRLRRELSPAQPWMYHGFRGKPQQLRSLLDAGMFVSFGFLRNGESLRLCPPGRLMLESDVEAHHSDGEARHIAILYNNVAAERGVDVSSLCAQMAENYRAFFRRQPSLA